MSDWDGWQRPPHLPFRTAADLAHLVIYELRDELWRTNGYGIYHRQVELITPRGEARIRVAHDPQHVLQRRYLCHVRLTFPDERVESIRVPTRNPPMLMIVRLCLDMLEECRDGLPDPVVGQ